MNWGAFLLIGVVLCGLLFGVQRTEARRRRLSLLLLFLMAALSWSWANFRDLKSEYLLALAVSLIVNFLFWLLIGRYNPVADSDETITVYGMDD